MSEHKKKRGRGKRTFFFILISRAKWYLLFGIALLAFAYLMYFGAWREATDNFFAAHADWNITNDMFSEWVSLLAVGFLLTAYLRARVLYRQYRFTIDEHAFTLLRGLYFTHETTIPYQQISNVHVFRPYHYKLFGIAKLDIVTAADRSMENSDNKAKKFLIPIIDTSEARKLSKYLLRKAAEHRKEEFIEAEEEDEDDSSDNDDEENEDADSEETDEENQE